MVQEKKLTRREAQQAALHYKQLSEQKQAQIYGYANTLNNIHEWMQANLTQQQIQDMGDFLTDKAKDDVAPESEKKPKIWMPSKKIITS